MDYWVIDYSAALILDQSGQADGGLILTLLRILCLQGNCYEVTLNTNAFKNNGSNVKMSGIYILPPCESWSQPAATPRKHFGFIIAEVAAPGLDESGWLPLDVTLKEEEKGDGGREGEIKRERESSRARPASSHRTLAAANVSACGRAAPSAAALRVQTFCCSWWRTLIMCSTKQEPGLHGRVAVQWPALETTLGLLHLRCHLADITS